MADILDYITLSTKALEIKEEYTNAKNFRLLYNEIDDDEKKSFLNHYIVSNSPFIFKEIPMLFRQIIQYLSDKVNIPTKDILLIGSAKTGFSISTNSYGEPYINSKRDFDFTIVNEELFYSIQDEFEQWVADYENRIVIPKNDTEKGFWNSNKFELPKNFDMGFVDTYKIPNYSDYKKVQTINNSMSLIVLHLSIKYSISAKQASVRVYKNWNTFINQLKRNTEHVFNNTKNV